MQNVQIPRRELYNSQIPVNKYVYLHKMQTVHIRYITVKKLKVI